MTTGVTNDLHGRDRLVKNTIINWIVLFVRFVSGFILPRLISDSLGQETLGIWDFAWTIVGYFDLVSGGVLSSINRYIAKYRAGQNDEDLNIYISTAAFVVRSMGMLIAVVSVSFLVLPDGLFSGKFLPLWQKALLPIVILGIGAAVQVSASVYGGICTGFHRWDVYNGIQVGTLLLLLVSSLAAIVNGGGLVALALINLSVETIGRICQVIASRKIYPGYRIKTGLFRWNIAKKMFIFGSKMYVLIISRMISVQTINVLIGGWLGPAMLAIFSRPHSLIRQISNIVEKYAMILVPTISSMQMTNEIKEIRKMSVASAHLTLCIALPMILLMVIFGGDILTLWMGSSYGIGLLITIISIGGLFEMAAIPLHRILMGMNMHGRLVFINLIASIAAAILSYIVIVPLHKGIIAIALATTIPLVVSQGIMIPVIFAKTLNMKAAYFFYEIWKKPLLCVIPYGVILWLLRMLGNWQPLGRVLTALVCGGCILGVTYWIGIVPQHVKNILIKKIKHIFRITK